MAANESHWSICPVEDCAYAVEYEAGDNFFCPSCELELISACPSCKYKVETESQALCGKCGESLKE